MKPTDRSPTTFPHRIIFEECSGEFLTLEEFHALEEASSIDELVDSTERRNYQGPGEPGSGAWVCDKSVHLIEKLNRQGVGSLDIHEVHLLRIAGKLERGESLLNFYEAEIPVREVILSQEELHEREEQEALESMNRRSSSTWILDVINGMSPIENGSLCLDEAAAQVVAKINRHGVGSLEPSDVYLLRGAGKKVRARSQSTNDAEPL